MKRPSLFLILPMVAIALIGCPKRPVTLDDIGAWNVAAVDPISAVGHGAIFGSDGSRITFTPESTIESQRFYLKRLYRQAGDTTRAAFTTRRREFEEAGPQTRAERLLVNAALIASLLDSMDVADGAQLASKNVALLSQFVRIEGDELPKDNGAGPISRRFFDVIVRAGGLKFLTATLAGGDSYIAECRRAGVPIPPDWGSPQWTNAGKLTVDFLGSTPVAEVFVAESQQPRGVCMALPRSKDDTIGLLGIICLGTESSKACYWDNQRNKVNFPIKKGTAVPLSSFAGGADLYGGTGGECTDCHAGENSYVVHPGQPMDLGSKIIPKNWMQPLVHPAWPQNAGPTNILNGVTPNPANSCLTCHGSDQRFPEVSTQTPGYCGTVLTKAYSQTMPLGSPGNPAFAADYNMLKAACGRAPSGGVVIGGATQAEPTSTRVDETVTLSSCTGGPDCPLGFCYWKTVHGPFWQTTPSSIPIDDLAFRGSFARIFVDRNQWKARILVDPTGGPPMAPPGGTLQCLNYQDIANLPDPKNCYANLFEVFDKDGTTASQQVNATVTGTASANVLSGFIGNVAQTSVDQRPDRLEVTAMSGQIVLGQSHALTPQPPLKLGPLKGESWTNGCTAWTPNYAVKDVVSTSDVQLVPAADADKVRCFITGVAGGWSSTRNKGTEQPFAEIYRGSGNDVRLRISPPGEIDQVRAHASCIRIK